MPKRKAKSTNPTLDNLKTARDLISDKAKWIKGDLKDDNGCLCALGAIAVATGIMSMTESLRVPSKFGVGYRDINRISAIYQGLEGRPEISELADYVPYGSAADDESIRIFRFNDSCNHEEIMDAFDSAIAYLSGEW